MGGTGPYLEQHGLEHVLRGWRHVDDDRAQIGAIAHELDGSWRDHHQAVSAGVHDAAHGAQVQRRRRELFIRRSTLFTINRIIIVLATLEKIALNRDQTNRISVTNHPVTDL